MTVSNRLPAEHESAGRHFLPAKTIVTACGPHRAAATFVCSARTDPGAGAHANAFCVGAFPSSFARPSEDGYSLIQSLRKGDLATPALAATAFGRAEDKARALQAGFDSHLAKPVAPAHLFKAIQNLLSARIVGRHPQDA